MQNKEPLCQPESYSVLIPYKDLERLVNIAQNQEKEIQKLERLEKRVSGLQKIYLEVLERLSEISDSL